MSSSLAGRANPAVDILVDVPLSFETAGERVHAPMLAVRIGGVETLLIVDTGSTDHVLTMELVGRAGLDARPGEAGTDHVGRPVTSWDLGTVPVDVTGRRFTLEGAVAIAAPDRFEARGIGGFLSPQHLHPTADVVVDLLDDRFLVLDGERDDVIVWLAERAPTLDAMTLERVPDDAEILVRAAIEPFDPVVTMLNTGGRGTEFAADALPGLTGTGSDQVIRGVSGETAPRTEAHDRHLRIGDRVLPVPRLLIREEMGLARGLVGMDLLRGTILLVAADRTRPILWMVPTEPSA